MNNIFINRIEKIQELLSAQNIDAVALIAGADLTYFSGLNFHLSERPILYIIKKSNTPILFHPFLEYGKVKNAPVDIQSIAYQEDPNSWLNAFSTISDEIKNSLRHIGIIPTQLRFLEYSILKKTFIHAEFQDASSLIATMQTKKDDYELEAIRKAISIAENALTNTLAFIKIRKTEKEIASELVMQLLKAGSDPNLPFLPIVASGVNSANPHAVPSEKKLAKGDLLIIDWGARFNGYISDITRTFAIGTLSSELREIADIVEKANRQARFAVYPGVKASQIDLQARETIRQKGFGEFFIHRTGHGIGLKEHEEPYINQTNENILETGMVFTIEPGIYLEHKGGIRIEDNIMVTANGSETLTSLPREIRILD